MSSSPTRTRKRRSSSSAPSAASSSASAGGTTLTFLRNEQRTSIPPYPSFAARLEGTDTWSTHASTSSGPREQGPLPPHLSLPPPSPSASSSFSRSSLSPSATRRRSSSPSAASHASHATSSSSKKRRGSPTSSKVDYALQSAQAAAVRAAVRSGELRAETYTDGQLAAVLARGERSLAASKGEEKHEHAEGEGGRKRRRGSGAEGREGEVRKAVKARRIEEVGDEDEAGGGGVQVEVDLAKLIGV
ncbi:hypothetical protein JCM10213_006657 [Rhodosporidiobolus nylandii]